MTQVPEADRQFAGSIPQLYAQLLVPLIFEPYAADLAERLVRVRPGQVLEVAAGTGVVTRQLDAALPPQVRIVATDLNAPMLEEASRTPASARVTWRQADALHLPFGDAAFDAVVCQFGAMFFPDRARGFAEMRRVLRPGGVLLFNVWDRIEHNEFAEAVQDAVGALFPARPPRFLERLPHGYHATDEVARDVALAGFAAAPEIATIAAVSRAERARTPAVAYCQGSPLRGEIEARGPDALAAATDAAEAELARRFGPGPIEGRIQAHVFTVAR